MSGPGEPSPTTTGTLLGGRVRYDQPRHGHRTGIEPVLLAAAVLARPGQRVLEAGTGAGAGLLCLAARVPDLALRGIEQDAGLAELARRNLSSNGLGERADIIAGDIGRVCLGAGSADHVFANPPWHDARGTPSPDGLRALARQRGPCLLAAWTAALTACLRPRGSLTFVLPASLLSQAMTSMTRAGCGALTLRPLWPRAGAPARLILLHGLRGARGADRILPGLILHETGVDGRTTYTAEALAILRDGSAL